MTAPDPTNLRRSNRIEQFNTIDEKDADEVHDHLVRTSARFAYGVRECPEADTGGFTRWKAPADFKIELFAVRVGDWGGYMMLDCDDPLAVHKFCSMLPVFEFEARPVGPVMDAVGVELEAIAWRDGLKHS